MILQVGAQSCLGFGSGDPILQGYTNAHYVGDEDSRKSTFGYLMNYARGAVLWQSRLQKCVSLSTTTT
jgi:hypothetical protein